MTDPDAHPRLVLRQIIDAVRHGLGLVCLWKIIRLHLFGIVLGPQLPAAILIGTHDLFLLGVNGKRRIIGLQLNAYHLIDVLELGIAIRVLGAFQALLVALQAIPQLFEQARHGVLLDVVPSLLQGEGQIAEAAGGPQQTAFWVAARRRLDQLLEIGQQRRVFVGGLFSTASRTTAARCGQRFEPPRCDGLAFLDPFADCSARHPSGSCNCGNAAETERHGLAGGKEPATALTQAGIETSKPLLDRHFGVFALAHAFCHESRVSRRSI
jgi:hypothetical protein